MRFGPLYVAYAITSSSFDDRRKMAAGRNGFNFFLTGDVIWYLQKSGACKMEFFYIEMADYSGTDGLFWYFKFNGKSASWISFSFTMISFLRIDIAVLRATCCCCSLSLAICCHVWPPVVWASVMHCTGVVRSIMPRKDSYDKYIVSICVLCGGAECLGLQEYNTHRSNSSRSTASVTDLKYF